MSRRTVPLILLILALCSFASYGKDEHTFACNSQNFDLSSFEGQASILSPDGRSRIQFQKDYKYAVFVRGKQVTALEYLDTNCCIEIGWSPDSSQFFVTYSDSATYHQYKTHLFSIAGEQVSENRAPQGVFEDFESQHSCPSRGGNNLFLLGWTKRFSGCIPCFRSDSNRRLWKGSGGLWRIPCERAGRDHSSPLRTEANGQNREGLPSSRYPASG